jgi:hypothetical protein
MIKNPGAVRERVLSDVMHMIKHMYLMLTMLPETERDVLLSLESPKAEALQVEVTNMLMAKFGHMTAPSEPRFDKTRRRLKRKAPKLRGANTYNNSAERRRHGAAAPTPIPAVLES